MMKMGPWYTGNTSRWASGNKWVMRFVYILQSGKNGRYYIGSTNDPVRRLLEHNSGKTRSLKHLVPLKIVFTQGFTGRETARRMERRLKGFKNRKILEQIIAEGEIKTYVGPVVYR